MGAGKKMKRNFKTVILIAATATLMFGCGSKEVEEAKNIDQIYAEQGIPVEAVEIQPVEFQVKLPYTAKLTGLRQSFASAMIGGRIEHIFVKVGDYVRKDQILISFPEDAPSGQYQQAKAALDIAESTFNRMNNLYELGGISKQDLDQVDAQYKVALANFDASSQMLKVRAPIDGYVTNIAVRETDGVHAEGVLATIAETKKMKAKAWVTEDEICNVQVGMKTTATWNNVTLTGKVTEVGMAMDPGTNAFAVNMEFDNASNMCKSGVMADIDIVSYNNESALIIERKNVLKDVKGKFVYLLKNEKAVKQYITTGQENGSFEITAGVTAGDKVITEGLHLVYDGAKVKL